MKKLFIGIIVAIILFAGAVFTGNYIFNKYAYVENDTNEISEEESEIISTDVRNANEIESRGLFDLGDGQTYYEIDLMANDMKWNDDARLYSKIIENKEDYEKYQERLKVLPEIDFENEALIIIANENFNEAKKRTKIQ